MLGTTLTTGTMAYTDFLPKGKGAESRSHRFVHHGKLYVCEFSVGEIPTYTMEQLRADKNVRRPGSRKAY